MNNWKQAEKRNISDLVNPGTIVIIAPHQDDESLGCGGTIALATRMGMEVHVVFITNGSQSHPGSKKYPHDKLISLREKEAIKALSLLGVEQANIHFLRLPDGGLPFLEDNEFNSAVKQISGVLKALKPGTLFLPWRRDPHRDHRATWQITMAALKGIGDPLLIYEYFIWLWERAATEDYPQLHEGTMCSVEITDTIQVKKRAIMAHVSQTTDLIDDDANGFTLSAEMLGHFNYPNEYFIETN